MAAWFGYGFVLPVLPIVGVALIWPSSALSLADLGGRGQIALAAIGVSASIIAQVVAGGHVSPRSREPLIWAGVSLVILSAFFYAHAAPPAPLAPQDFVDVAVKSLMMLGFAGATGLLVSGL